MVSWVFKLGFQTPPNGCLDQLDPILALGAALFLQPIKKSTSHGQLHCPNFTHSCKVYFGCDFYNQNMIKKYVCEISSV